LLGDAESLLGDATSSLGDAESLLGGGHSTLLTACAVASRVPAVPHTRPAGDAVQVAAPTDAAWEAHPSPSVRGNPHTSQKEGVRGAAVAAAAAHAGWRMVGSSEPDLKRLVKPDLNRPFGTPG
jgi:hypothetical protein